MPFVVKSVFNVGDQQYPIMSISWLLHFCTSYMKADLMKQDFAWGACGRGFI